MKTLIASLAVLAATALPLAALAADATTTKPARAELSACKTDAAKLCPGIEPGGGRLKACFKEHRKELSAECKSEMKTMRQRKKGD